MTASPRPNSRANFLGDIGSMLGIHRDTNHSKQSGYGYSNAYYNDDDDDDKLVNDDELNDRCDRFMDDRGIQCE